MALTRNRETRYENFVEFVEHKTGKRVLSWGRATDRLCCYIYFTDKTMLEVIEYEGFPDEPVYKPIPGSICASCGENSHAGYINWKRQCVVTMRNFWERVRKVYWHRYTQNQ
jgi:acetone carboxylase gamma subunit